jgi:hypothetical protein
MKLLQAASDWRAKPSFHSQKGSKTLVWKMVVCFIMLGRSAREWSELTRPHDIWEPVKSAHKEVRGANSEKQCRTSLRSNSSFIKKKSHDASVMPESFWCCWECVKSLGGKICFELFQALSTKLILPSALVWSGLEQGRERIYWLYNLPVSWSQVSPLINGGLSLFRSHDLPQFGR